MARKIHHLFFALFVLVDAAVVGLGLLLGLAAAAPSHTPVLGVLAFFAVPGLMLAAVVALYLRGPWRAARPVATVLAALPVMLVLGGALLSNLAEAWLGDIDGRPVQAARTQAAQTQEAQRPGR